MKIGREVKITETGKIGVIEGIDDVNNVFKVRISPTELIEVVKTGVTVVGLVFPLIKEIWYFFFPSRRPKIQ